MWLDELEQTVQNLADRIKQHGHILRGNEQATRYALIDPLLASLGWNLADPSEVVAEYRLGDSGDGKVDYAMLYDGEPYLLIEAKNLGERLSRAAEQAGRYVMTTRAQYVVLTNGEQWEGYSLGGPGNKHVFEFNVTRRDSPVLDLLWLWHGNFKGKTTAPRLHEPASKPSPASDTSTSRKRSTSGVPLPDVKYVTGMNKPRRLVFPDGTEDVTKSWARIQPATAEWLIDSGYVSRLPLCNDQGTHLMHKTPTARDGNPFKKAKEVRKNHWINMSQNPAGHLTRATELLVSCGLNAATVLLELS